MTILLDSQNWLRPLAAIFFLYINYDLKSIGRRSIKIMSAVQYSILANGFGK